MLDDDDRAGERRAELIADGAADDAGGRSRLRGGGRRVQAVQDGRQKDAGQEPCSGADDGTARAVLVEVRRFRARHDAGF